MYEGPAACMIQGPAGGRDSEECVRDNNMVYPVIFSMDDRYIVVLSTVLAQDHFYSDFLSLYQT